MNKTQSLLVQGKVWSHDVLDPELDSNASEIALHSDGSFICLDDQINWCKHIEHLLKRNGDWIPIWEELKAQDNHIFEFQVPMQPSVNLFATVALVGITAGKSNQINVAQVDLISPFSLENGTASYLEDDNIGYLNPGEGLLVVRQMIWELYRPAVFNNNKTILCTDKMHSFQAQMRWEDGMKDENNRLIEYHSVITTGKCIYCQLANTVQDFSDLVPELEKRAGFPRR